VKKKRKIRAITALKVIQGHRGRYKSKARMRPPISVQILDTLRFSAPFGEQRTMFILDLLESA